MLVTAREDDCQYIWNAHAASARAAGVSDATVGCLKFLDPRFQSSFDKGEYEMFSHIMVGSNDIARGSTRGRFHGQSSRARELRSAQAVAHPERQLTIDCKVLLRYIAEEGDRITCAVRPRWCHLWARSALQGAEGTRSLAFQPE
jgi:hypothetical protein